MRINRMKVMAVLCLAAGTIGAYAQTSASATRNGSHVLQGDFVVAGTSPTFTENSANSKRLGYGGSAASSRCNQPIWGLDLPSIPAGETLTTATLSVDVLSISGGTLFFEGLASLMTATNVSEFSADPSAYFVAETAPLDTVLSNGIVFAQFAQSDVPNPGTLEIPVTGAALDQLNSLYDASGTPTQSTIWFRLSTSPTNDPAAWQGDRIQFADGDSITEAAFGFKLSWAAVPEFIADPVVKANVTWGTDYATLSQTLAGSATNSAGSPTFYEKTGGPAWLNVASNGTLSGIADVVGTNEFSIKAIVGENLDTATLQIVVDPLGNAPEFTSDPIIKASSAFEEDYGLLSQSLTNNATDLDDDTLVYLKNSGPDWLNVASNGTLSGVCDVIGTNSFTVTVDDGNGNSDSAELQIYVAPPTTQAPDPDGLFAHWAINEGIGTTTVDESGNGHDGAIDGAIWVTNGTGSRATYLSFDGTNDYVNPSLTLPLMTTENDFTWSVWANNQLDASAGSQKNGIIIGNRRDGSGTNTDLSPREFIKFTPNNLEWRPNDVANGTSLGALPVGTWVHLVVVKEGANIRTYVDGVAGDINTTTSFVNAMPFFIGGEPSLTTGEHFAGFVDDVRLYDYALNIAEILYVMNDGGEVDLSSEITEYSFDPSGTHSLSFQGAPISAYIIKSTDNLPFGGYTTVTPSAVTTGSLDGDVIKTDATGTAAAEFTETAPAQFYKVESAQ